MAETGVRKNVSGGVSEKGYGRTSPQTSLEKVPGQCIWGTSPNNAPENVSEKCTWESTREMTLVRRHPGKGTLENVRISGARRGISRVEQFPPPRRRRHCGNVCEKRCWAKYLGKRLWQTVSETVAGNVSKCAGEKALAKRPRKNAPGKLSPNPCQKQGHEKRLWERVRKGVSENVPGNVTGKGPRKTHLGNAPK